MTKQNSIEQRFRKLDDIEHCLLRPGMYVGSTKTREEEVYLFNEQSKFVKQPVQVNPAFMKVFDEIVANAADEHKRNTKLNQITVVTDMTTGRITVTDNGGIPVVKHREHDEWVPEMIFSNLKAGSNFDDSEERLVAGTNGVGATLTNIFSTEFRIRTCDGKQQFDQIFTDNMRSRTNPVVTRGNKGFTEISFVPDFSRFGMTGLDENHVELMRKRCADLAACNPLVRVEFNGERFSFSSFAAYCRHYVDNVIYEGSERWRIAVASSNGSMQQVSFVNGVETKDGGTHVDSVVWQVVEALRVRLKKKHKVDLKPAEVRNHLFVFVGCDIVNSSFSSQTKEKLITDPRDFGSRHELSDKFLKQVCESEAVQRILDWAKQKDMADERRKLRELNKHISKEKVLKLIDAKSRNREDCTLALFEGDSASGAFRKYRDPQTQGAFPLRGKFLNVSEMSASSVIQNQEVKNILTALGLRMGEEPKDLRYGKILVYSDADPDGDNIASLLVNFFGRYWPDILAQKRLYRVMTPLVVAKKGSTTLPFYTHEDFEKWQKMTKDVKKWDVSYKKGLAALEDAEYAEIIKNPQMFAILPGEHLKQVLDHWFGADPSMRKKKILGTV